jgi:CrcB protein
MKLALAIGFGSFIGGTLRYLISGFFQVRYSAAFPFATLTVNLLGCLLIGVVFGFFDKGSMGNDLKLFITTGILGGFTTFSAFSQETFNLIRAGQTSTALVYVLASVVLGILLTFIGYSLHRIL